jgi:F-type H+-transporting ATPase subunit b
MQREVLEKANVQATRLIEEARAAAARVQEQETQKAIAQAEQIISKAREATVLERQRMLIELKREVGALVVQTTGLVAGKVLTAEDQQRLVEETRRQLAA